MQITEILSKSIDDVIRGEKELSKFYLFFWRNTALLNSEQFLQVLAEIKERIYGNEQEKCWYSLSEAILYTFSPNIGNPFVKVTEAIEQFRQINDLPGEGAAKALLIIYYKNLGQLDTAQACVQECNNLIANNKFYSYFLVMANYQAGEIHHLLKDYDTAIEYFNKGLKVGLDNDIIAARMLNGLATVYMTKKQPDIAHEYFKKSLEQSQSRNDFLVESKNYADIGNYHLQKGDFEKALAFHHQSLQLRLDKKLYIPAITNYIELAELYFKQKKLDEALEYALMAEKQASELNIIIKLFQVHRVLSSIYEALDQPTEALNHFKKFHHFQEEVYNQENARKIKQLSMHHQVETAQQEKEIFRLRNVELKSALDDIEASVRYAKHIQEAILPPSRIVKEYLPDSFIIYKPKDIVAGDFYWIEKKGELLFFAAADCTGHGVPGAMVSVVCSNALNSCVKEFGLTKPASILDKARELIIEQFRKSDEDVKDGMDISLCVLNTKTNELSWAGANNPLWIISNNELKEFKADKQPVGYYPDSKPFTNHLTVINRGDKIYLFTDGYADQFGGPVGKKFKIAALRKLILEAHPLPMSKQQEHILTTFTTWQGKLSQVDDVCLIGIQY